MNRYNKTYGALAAVVVFLVWLWVSNVAILVGAEFDAELARGRRAASDDAPPVPGPRETDSLAPVRAEPS